jgi:hypothetical protein
MKKLIEYVNDKKIEFKIEQFSFDGDIIYITLSSDYMGEIIRWRMTCRTVFRFRFTSSPIEALQIKMGVIILGDTYVYAGQFECERL